ncbi:hypothetical protein [Aquitalea sp. LB_tupeE]|uniref:hypothetical protein n=1 Tax=Aquitalea sp. LB_tupeE TaxID=2748078 RepID=UPI0015BD9C55|nr:hypothetical protein [Aquitalea sp. LB_tupeE]NWK79262.1 hypothetical protein [Aquitalea sp. LB_tupeE]
MNQSPTPDLPSWDELDLPVLDEVVDESAIPVLAEEVLDVPDFDFSSEMDAAHSALPSPAEGVAELDIPELTLEDLEVAAPPVSDSPALDLSGLPSLDLNEAADELELGQVLHGTDPLSLAIPPGVQASPRPEAPLMAVDGFEFVLDEAIPTSLADLPDALAEISPAPPTVSPAPSVHHSPEAVADQTLPVVEDELEIPALTDALDENLPVQPVATPTPSAVSATEAVSVQALPKVEEELQIPDLSDDLDIDWNSMAEQAAPVVAAPPDFATAPSQPAAPAEAAPHVQAVDAQPPVSVDQPPALPAGLSISLDSLPAGVLGGGIGRLEEETPSTSELLARAQALVDAAPTSLDEVLRAAEQTLAQQDALTPPAQAEAMPEPKSFTSLSEAELLEAMATLPTRQPATLIDQDWPGLGDDSMAHDLSAGLQDEADIHAASALLQDDSLDNLAPVAAAVQSPEVTAQHLPVLDEEESWPGLGDVDRDSETELLLSDEPDSASPPEPERDAQSERAAPVVPTQDLPVLDEEESWPGLGDVDRESETELCLPNEADALQPVAVSAPVTSSPVLPVLNEEADLPPPAASQLQSAQAPEVTPPAAGVSTPVPGLFAESPFASERQVLPQPASVEALPATAAPEAELELPVLTETEPADQALAEPLVPATPVEADSRSEPVPPATLETLTGASFAAAMPQTAVAGSGVAPETGKSVEVLSVAAVTTAAAAAALMNPAARKEETVAVVDERALVDAMYEKLLPRMKVELSLWLQDALELQAKNMLSGVMQQLKEDYDMLFGETLKESLRQAILALGREQQGKAAQDKEQD